MQPERTEQDDAIRRYRDACSIFALIAFQRYARHGLGLEK
jgi:hypothetical protein